ncbi:MAG: tetratricopeptide repeat protein [Bacteroidales bacterium]|nr:tetratricopeptide repeat protein [Bacteroidales bacterium]MBN2757151.1 tetratricopeptide repeat protein [Bacteroidales bacterium]
MNKKTLYTALFILIFTQAFASNPVVDSLNNELKKDIHDTTRVSIYNQISFIYTKLKPDSAFVYVDFAFDLSKSMLESENKKIVAFAKRSRADSYTILGDYYKAIGDYFSALENYKKSVELLTELNDEKAIAKNYIDIGIIKSLQSNYIVSEEYYRKAQIILEKLNDETGLAKLYRNLGNVYYYQGDYPMAIEYYQKSLALSEKIDDLTSASRSFNNIGYIHFLTNRYNWAIDYFNKSLAIKEKIGDSRGIATVYNNMGDVYYEQKDFKNALEYYSKSLKIREDAKATRDIAFSLRNIGRVFFADSNYVKSEEFYMKSLKINQEIEDKEQESLLLAEVASLKFEQKKYNEAIKFANNSLTIALELKALPRQMDAYKLLAEANEMQNNTIKAYDYLKKYIVVKDSISERAAKKLIESETRYKIGKKQKELESQNLELEKQEAIVKNQKMQMFILLGGIALMLILAFVFYRNYKQKIKANELLKEQKQEIEAQKEEIEKQRDIGLQQKKEITDSIIYAENIQRAVMPSDEFMHTVLSDYFMLFRPKDIVSGDFYWMKKIKNFLVVAIADCTGHGVPGAFMSMLGSIFLNETVTSRSLDNAGQILDKLREKIKKSLHQSGKEGEAKDGMDMSFFIIDTETLELQFAGAYNPLYIIRENVTQEILDKETEKGAVIYNSKDINENAYFIELKGDRQPIAIYSYEKEFSNYTIQLQKGDRIYSLSDGYPDQFGGIDGKKFKAKGLKDFLLSIYKEDMKTQHELLNKQFEDWKGEIEQIDDVILFGLKVDF